MKDEGFDPDVVTYAILINAHSKAKRYDEAIELFREMESKNVKATPHVFRIFINGLGSEKRLSEALEFFELNKASGLETEAPTYNALAGAYCWSMRMQDAFRVVDEMKKCGIGPNAQTCDIILHHLVKARREQAYSIFQQISHGEPTVTTYEVMVRMFCNEDRVDMALQVWDMFSTLINSLCHGNKLDDACKYFKEMLDAGNRPPGQLFGNLKQALLDEGRKDDVISLGLKIDKLRNTPLLGLR